jgi:hypothetical protein
LRFRNTQTFLKNWINDSNPKYTEINFLNSIYKKFKQKYWKEIPKTKIKTKQMKLQKASQKEDQIFDHKVKTMTRQMENL